MRLTNTERGRRTSDRRNNDVSWISEVKDMSNVTVKKKRGRRAHPSANSLHGTKADKMIDSDDAADNDNDDNDDTHEGQISKSQSIDKGKDKGFDSEPSGQNALANEDGSNVQAAVVKKDIDEEGSSQPIKDPQALDAQVNTTTSEDRSSEEVEDVKVCDICGDVGEEEKLAVCSRCNDGAEHIYCMRVMMEEVPDTEWLCEDCESQVEFEKNSDKCQVNVDTSKGQAFEGKVNKPASAAKSRSSSDNEFEAENGGSKESDTANKENDMVNDRMEADAADTSTVRETTAQPGLNMPGDSRKRMPPSRESSFRSDMGKGKQPSHQVPTSLVSNALKNQATQPRGQLTKSTSFNNSKVPKVKQLLSEVPQKPKNFIEAWASTIKKDGPISMTTKSATFKKPKPCGPANKEKSSILSPAEEPRVINSSVSQSVTNDICASILGYPSATASADAPAVSKADTVAQNLATGNNMAEPKNLSTAHGHHGKGPLGNCELKKPPLVKVPGSTVLWNAEKSSGILGAGAHRKVNSDRDNKVKDQHGLKPGAPSSNRTIRCQRCNEVGHSTQFCAVDKLRLSAVKPLSERNLKDASVKQNKISETSTLVAAEKDAFIGNPVDSCPTMSSVRRDESNQGVSTGDKPTASTVPEMDYIWQGGFELWRSGRSELCDGFQAHLSCSASQLVIDVAKKFPSKVQLEELPRQNSWPAQFQERGPTFDNIGVFFFARDVQSYETHYSKLVEKMLKNDLVLKGSVDTFELLIFPSNVLSKNCQRWNMFYFLWGVFRVARKDCSNIPPDGPTNRDTNLGKPAGNDNHYLLSLEAKHQECSNGEKSLNQASSGKPSDDHHASVTARYSTNSNGTINLSTAAESKIQHQKPDDSEKDKVQHIFEGNVSERDLDVNTLPAECPVSLIHEEEPGKGSRIINLNDAEQPMDIDHVNTTVNTTPDPFPYVSDHVRKRNFDMANSGAEVDVATGHNKKVKTDSLVPGNSGVSGNSNNGRLSSKVHPIGASCINDGTDNKAMAGSSNTGGNHVFPLDLNAADDDASGNVVNILSSDEEMPDAVQGPDQEMGDEISLEKGIPSFNPNKAGEKQTKGDDMPSDTSGSLSLALGFLPRKEQA